MSQSRLLQHRRQARHRICQVGPKMLWRNTDSAAVHLTDKQPPRAGADGLCDIERV